MYAPRSDEPPLLLRSSGYIPFSELKLSLAKWDIILIVVILALYERQNDNIESGSTILPFVLGLSKGRRNHSQHKPPHNACINSSSGLHTMSGHHESPAHAYRAPPQGVPASAYPGQLGGRELGHHNSAVRGGSANAAPHSQAAESSF